MIAPTHPSIGSDSWQFEASAQGLRQSQPTSRPPIDADTSKSLAALVRRANHDELTGLANRSWFITEVERMGSTASTGSVLFLLDLDGFKTINDNWGHAAGDNVLAEVGRRLQGIPGALAARFGGDEFALWIGGCSHSEAQFLAAKLVSAIAEPIQDDLMLSVGASVGWMAGDATTPINALLGGADIALYAVKERGGGGHQVFTRELATSRLEGRVLLREVRQGLSSRQFALAAQPIVLTSTGAVVGHEALARWHHPRRGILLPASFLPAVASAGMNQDFDLQILSLCREAATISPVRGLPLWINLTEASLTSQMVECLAEDVARIRGLGCEIVIEISEKASAESESAIRSIEAIAELGVAIAIDDFGSGYSRLGAMARLPISYVKIDRQFIHGVAMDPDLRSLTSAIINLTHAIGAEAVAEGVERADDLAVLDTMGCDYAQGFLIDRPALIDLTQQQPAVVHSP